MVADHFSVHFGTFCEWDCSVPNMTCPVVMPGTAGKSAVVSGGRGNVGNVKARASEIISKTRQEIIPNKIRAFSCDEAVNFPLFPLFPPLSRWRHPASARQRKGIIVMITGHRR